MAARLIAAVERVPSRARGVVVAGAVVLLLAGAITSVTFEAAPGGATRRLAPIPPRLSRGVPARPRRPPVSAAGLDAARAVASRFLGSYLELVYGRASATSVRAVTPELRGRLNRGRVQVTPVQRRRRPRVVWLQLVGTTPGFVVATARVDDGGVAPYRLRFSLEQPSGRWLVGAVGEG